MTYGVDTRKRRSPLILGLGTVGLFLASSAQGGVIGLGLGALAILFGVGFLRSLSKPPEEHGFGQAIAPTRQKREPVDISLPDSSFESAPAPMPIPPNLMAEIDDLLAKGTKIDAIKLYREQAGVGLREAKNAVETRAAQISGAGQARRDGPWG